MATRCHSVTDIIFYAGILLLLVAAVVVVVVVVVFKSKTVVLNDLLDFHIYIE
jgi:hypothetical protein